MNFFRRIFKILLNQNVFLTSIDLTCLRFLNIEKNFRNTKKFTLKDFLHYQIFRQTTCQKHESSPDLKT